MIRSVLGISAAILLSCLAHVTAAAGQFEGIVLLNAEPVFTERFYAENDTSRMPGYHQQIVKMLGSSRQEFRFRPGVFRVITHTVQGMRDQIFQLDRDRVLTLEDGDEAYAVKQSQGWMKRVEEVRLLSDTMQILGRSCRGIQLKLYDTFMEDSTVMRVYADSALYVDPEQFSKVKRDAWDAIFGELHAIPLAFEIELPRPAGLVLQFRAVEINMIKLEESQIQPDPEFPIHND